MITSITIDALETQLAELRAAEAADADARAAIITRRIEAEQAARAASFEASRPKQRGNLTIHVPAHIGLSHFYGNGGRVCVVRELDGRTVIDLFPAEFRSLLAGQHGNDWRLANPEALALLAR